MKKNDWILAAVVIVFALFILGFQLMRGNGEEREVVVTVAGEEFGVYQMDGEQKIDVNGTNRILIKDGTVVMEYADCPDQICVEHKKISRGGESIICLPNEVVVSVQGGKNRQLDGIAQ